MVQRVDPTGTPEDLAAIGYDGRTWDRPWNLPRGQITTLERMPSAWLETGGDAVELPRGEELDLEDGTGTDPLTGRPMSARRAARPTTVQRRPRSSCTEAGSCTSPTATGSARTTTTSSTPARRP